MSHKNIFIWYMIGGLLILLLGLGFAVLTFQYFGFALILVGFGQMLLGAALSLSDERILNPASILMLIMCWALIMTPYWIRLFNSFPKDNQMAQQFLDSMETVMFVCALVCAMTSSLPTILSNNYCLAFGGSTSSTASSSKLSFNNKISILMVILTIIGLLVTLLGPELRMMFNLKGVVAP